MASRQNLTGRRGPSYGYGGGALAAAYGGPANYVNPKMEEWRRQQSGEELVKGDDRAKARIAKAQQTGVGRGTQEQIIRHTTPGGTGYNRAEAIARERELATRPEAEQIAMLGRKANPNAGAEPPTNAPGPPGGVRTAKPAVEPGAGQWTPEQKQRWREDQKDLQNPFGPRMRKGESGAYSPEQKAAWRRGETPRQQLASITGGQAGLDRAWERMSAMTGRERPGEAADAPWKAERAKAMGESRAAEMGARGAGGGMFRRDPSSTGAIDASGGGFRGRKLGGRGGLMAQAIQRNQAKRQTAGPDRSPVVSANRRARQRVAGLSGGSTKPKARTGGIGGTGGSIRSRGLRGRGIGATT